MDYEPLVIIDPNHRHKIAILYNQGLIAGFIGKKDEPILHSDNMTVLSEYWLGNRNDWYFLCKSSKKNRAMGKKGRYDNLWIPKKDSIWLPVNKCLNEIAIAESQKVNFHYAWTHKKKVIPSDTDSKGLQYFETQIRPYPKGEFFFYGIEGWHDGPHANLLRSPVPPVTGLASHYLKIGWTGDMDERYDGRDAMHKKLYLNSRTRLLWVVPVSSQEEAERHETAFELSFGSHCCRWNDKERFLQEYFIYDDVIQHAASVLSKKFPPLVRSSDRSIQV